VCLFTPWRNTGGALALDRRESTLRPAAKNPLHTEEEAVWRTGSLLSLQGSELRSVQTVAKSLYLLSSPSLCNHHNYSTCRVWRQTATYTKQEHSPQDSPRNFSVCDRVAGDGDLSAAPRGVAILPHSSHLELTFCKERTYRLSINTNSNTP